MVMTDTKMLFSKLRGICPFIRIPIEGILSNMVGKMRLDKYVLVNIFVFIISFITTCDRKQLKKVCLQK